MNVYLKLIARGLGNSPRKNPEKLTALDPPVTLPLGTGNGGTLSVALATYCQLYLLVVRAMGCPPGVRRGGPSPPVS